jgi:DGQHR domain-containing protein
MPKPSYLEIPAIAIRQGVDRELYAFGIDGKKLHDIAEVFRLGRTEDNGLLGYQRPEVMSHIREIRAYLESDHAMLPNAIVVAFDSRVNFVSSGMESSSIPGAARHGILRVPEDMANKPGWIVDGQQRSAAIREADLIQFPVFVTAFVADDVDEQRSQFILVNATKPLPKGLIYELLPSTDMHLPTGLQKKKVPSQLLQILNTSIDSPLKGRIQTPTSPKGYIKDNSILRMLENSLNDGALYRQLVARPSRDLDACIELLVIYWSAVSRVFPMEWDLPPTKSRLTHGAGITSMGHLMDAISDRYRTQGVPSSEQFEANIAPLKDYCCWTTGHWEFGPGVNRKWNEIQNTSKDIQMLASHLLVHYKTKVWQS